MAPIAMHRLDIWWADVPGDKRRPILILTRERFIERLNSVLVAPITTTVRDIPTEVPLDAADGMPAACAANFDNVFTLRRDRCVEPITRLGPERAIEVCTALKFATGC